MGDIVFHTSDAGHALLLMLLGLVGIFVVMTVVMAAVYLLNKFAKDKPAEDGDKNTSGK